MDWFNNDNKVKKNINNDDNFMKSEYSVDSYRSIMSIIVLGYFGIKLINKTINDDNKVEDSSCFQNTQYDFMGVVLFGSIIYLFNSYLTHIEIGKSISFIIFYILGLTFGYLYKQGKNQINEEGDSMLLGVLTSLYYFMIVVVIFFSLYISSSSPTKIVPYVLFLVIFTGIAFFLNKFNKKYRDGKDTIYVFSDKFVLTVPMLAFMTNMLFIRGNVHIDLMSDALEMFSGLFLGIFVSCVAVFGIRSLIPEQRRLVCTSKTGNKDCKMKVIKDDSLVDAYKASKLANTTLIILLISIAANAGILGYSVLKNRF